jgi:hypothetical protein
MPPAGPCSQRPVSSSPPPPAAGGWAATPAASSHGRPPDWRPRDARRSRSRHPLPARPAAESPHRPGTWSASPWAGRARRTGSCGSPATRCCMTASARSPTASRSTPPCSTWDACASRSPGRCATAWTPGRPSSRASWSAPAPSSPSTTKAGPTSTKTDPPSSGGIRISGIWRSWQGGGRRARRAGQRGPAVSPRAAAASWPVWRMVKAKKIWEKPRNNAKNPTQNKSR